MGGGGMYLPSGIRKGQEPKCLKRRLGKRQRESKRKGANPYSWGIDITTENMKPKDSEQKEMSPRRAERGELSKVDDEGKNGREKEGDWEGTFSGSISMGASRDED